MQKLGEDESYRLEVTPAHAHLTAPNPLGALRGMETFLQLVEPAETDLPRRPCTSRTGRVSRGAA